MTLLHSQLRSHRRSTALLIALATLLVVACTSDGDPPAATDTASPTAAATAAPSRPTPAATTRAPFILQTPTPFPTPEAMAPDRIAETNARRTGLAEVDRVIDALFGDDVAALDSLVRAQSAICHEEVRGLGDVEVCPEGVPAGTLVEFFVAGNCHGYPQHDRPFVHPLDPHRAALYTVVNVPDSGPAVEHFPSGDQMILFIVDGTPPTNVMGFLIEDGLLVHRVGGCGNTAASLLALVADPPDYLLQPFALPE